MNRPRWSRDLAIWVDLLAGVISAGERHPTAAAIERALELGADSAAAFAPRSAEDGSPERV